MPEKLRFSKDGLGTYDQTQTVMLAAWLDGNDFPWLDDEYVVSLTVNGKEVSFTKMVEKIRRDYLDVFNRAVAEEVHEVLASSKLVGLVQKLEDMIVSEIQDRTGVNINDDGKD